MNRDRYDLPLTTASDRAAAHYRDGVDCMLSAWHGAEDAFDRAIREDAGFALAHIARARLPSAQYARKRGARAWPRMPRQLAAAASPRERQHVEIMAAVIESKPETRGDRRRSTSATNIPAMRWCCRCCSARSASMRFRGAPTTTPPSLRVCERTARALWRGLVVPELSRLVAYGSRKPQHRPRFERTRDGDAGRKRQRRARPVARDVRAGRHGSGPKVSVAMAARA